MRFFFGRKVKEKGDTYSTALNNLIIAQKNFKKKTFSTTKRVVLFGYKDR